MLEHSSELVERQARGVGGDDDGRRIGRFESQINRTLGLGILGYVFDHEIRYLDRRSRNRRHPLGKARHVGGATAPDNRLKAPRGEGLGDAQAHRPSAHQEDTLDRSTCCFSRRRHRAPLCIRGGAVTAHTSGFVARWFMRSSRTLWLPRPAQLLAVVTTKLGSGRHAERPNTAKSWRREWNARSARQSSAWSLRHLHSRSKAPVDHFLWHMGRNS
jgi:hypothetical protein